MDGSAKGDLAERFFFVEWAALRENRALVAGMMNERVNYFMLFVSATFIAVGVLVSALVDSGWAEGEKRNGMLLVAILLLVPVLVMGLFLYLRLIDWRIIGVRYIRAINMVRAYFIDELMATEDYSASKYARYIWLRSDHAHPRFRGSRATGPFSNVVEHGTLVVPINAATAGAITAMILGFSLDNLLSDCLIGGLFITMLVFLLQIGYSNHRMSKAESDWDFQMSTHPYYGRGQPSGA